LPEIAVIAGIAALVFGPSKLPELGKGLGQTVKSFQTAAKEFETELKAASKGDEPTATPGSTEEAKKDLKQLKDNMFAMGVLHAPACQFLTRVGTCWVSC
ncbi:hypothetical protein QJQ45_022498, partial [Haematococcus lacustris]